MNPILEAALTELFKAVADVVDGGDDWDSVHDCYMEIWKSPEVKEFYGHLIENNQFRRLVD